MYTSNRTLFSFYFLFSVFLSLTWYQSEKYLRVPATPPPLVSPAAPPPSASASPTAVMWPAPRRRRVLPSVAPCPTANRRVRLSPCSAVWSSPYQPSSCGLRPHLVASCPPSRPAHPSTVASGRRPAVPCPAAPSGHRPASRRALLPVVALPSRRSSVWSSPCLRLTVAPCPSVASCPAVAPCHRASCCLRPAVVLPAPCRRALLPAVTPCPASALLYRPAAFVLLPPLICTAASTHIPPPVHLPSY